MPVLHLSLGIFNCLYDLLEDACGRLDLELADKLNTAGIGGASFQRYAELLQQLRQLQGEDSCLREAESAISATDISSCVSH